MSDNPWSSLKGNVVGDPEEPSTEELLRRYIDQKRQETAAPRPVNRSPAELVDENGDLIPGSDRSSREYKGRQLDQLAGALAARNGIKDPDNLRSIAEQDAADYGMNPWDTPKIVTMPGNQLNDFVNRNNKPGARYISVGGFYHNSPTLRREPPMVSEYDPNGFIMLNQKTGPGSTWRQDRDLHHEMSHANYWTNPEFERLKSGARLDPNVSGNVLLDRPQPQRPRFGDPTHSGGYVTVDPTAYGFSHGIDNNMYTDLMDDLDKNGGSIWRLMRQQKQGDY